MIDGRFWEYDWSVAMRRLLLAVAIWGAMSAARAADLPDIPILRGTQGLTSAKVNWQGFYAGGQGGYGSSDESFGGSTSDMVAALVQNLVIEQMGVSQWNLGLGKVSTRSAAYGGFTGYNSQWDDVILGVEASYLHGSFGGSTSASQGGTSTAPLSDGQFHSVFATSSASIAISDMATFRGRAGYAWGCFLPYVFGGFALGKADINRSVRIQDSAGPTEFGPFTNFAPLIANDGTSNHMVYGYSAGLGVDISLIGGLFMRAEWEYVRFTDNIEVNVNTVRAGLGYKF
jgi:opacity protein-like surface antigen